MSTTMAKKLINHDHNWLNLIALNDWKPLAHWMQHNWFCCVYISIVYVFVIFTIKQKMQDREPFKLRNALALWNAFLGIFSVAGAYYMLPEMFSSLRKSFHHSVCYASTIERSQFWMWLFALSKIVELGDTLFIVLRKQNLIFLHWFHHIFAFIYTWYSFSQNISLGRWFVTMNYCVHSLMYSYYALRALKYRIPRPIAMSITTLQILQMILGFYVCYYALSAKLSNSYCEIPMRTATFGFLMYIAFFYMFADFFLRAYAQNLYRTQKYCLKLFSSKKMIPRSRLVSPSNTKVE